MYSSIIYTSLFVTLGFLVLFIAFIIVLKRYYRTNNQTQKLLFRSIIEAQENERRVISSNIHDELGSLLTSARMTITKMKRNRPMLETDTDLEHLNEVIELASLTAKNASNALTPAVIAKYGLKGALEDFPFIYKNTSVMFDIKYKFDNILPEFLQISLFRIISELLNNSIKHAHASLISIYITKNENEHLNLVFMDNGIGFEYPNMLGKSNGLLNILNRCKLLNAKFVVNTSKGNGFKFSLILNVNEQ